VDAGLRRNDVESTESHFQSRLVLLGNPARRRGMESHGKVVAEWPEVMKRPNFPHKGFLGVPENPYF
jgi:hypothetical protein